MLIHNKADKKFFHYLEYNSDIFVFSILIAIKTLKFGKFISPIEYNLEQLSPPVLTSSIAIISMALFFKKLTRIKVLYIINLIISFILFADTVYYVYYKDILSIADIRSGWELKDVGLAVFGIVKPQLLLYFIDFILFIPIFNLYNKSRNADNCSSKRFFIAIFVLVLAIILNAKYYNDLFKDHPHLLRTMDDKIHIAKTLGNLNYHIIDIYRFISIYMY